MPAPTLPGILAVSTGAATSLQALIVATGVAVSPAGPDPVACDLVDAASAAAVLGDGVTNPGGAATPGACRYDSADGSLILMVQILPASLYDAMPINPRTPVDIGDRGRYGVGASGSANVQFAKGDFSVTVRVSPSHRSGPTAAGLVQPVLEIARLAVDRMPD